MKYTKNLFVLLTCLAGCISINANPTLAFSRNITRAAYMAAAKPRYGFRLIGSFVRVHYTLTETHKQVMPGKSFANQVKFKATANLGAMKAAVTCPELRSKATGVLKQGACMLAVQEGFATSAEEAESILNATMLYYQKIYLSTWSKWFKK